MLAISTVSSIIQYIHQTHEHRFVKGAGFRTTLPTISRVVRQMPREQPDSEDLQVA